MGTKGFWWFFFLQQSARSRRILQSSMPHRATTMTGMLTECRKVTCHTSICLFVCLFAWQRYQELQVKHHPIRVEKLQLKRGPISNWRRSQFGTKVLPCYVTLRCLDFTSKTFQFRAWQSLLLLFFFGGGGGGRIWTYNDIHHGFLWNLVNMSFRWSWFLESASSFLSGLLRHRPKSKVPDGGTLEFRILVTWRRYQAVQHENITFYPPYPQLGNPSIKQ